MVEVKVVIDLSQDVKSLLTGFLKPCAANNVKAAAIVKAEPKKAEVKADPVEKAAEAIPPKEEKKEEPKAEPEAKEPPIDRASLKAYCATRKAQGVNVTEQIRKVANVERFKDVPDELLPALYKAIKEA